MSEDYAEMTPEEVEQAKAELLYRYATPEGLIEGALRDVEKACRRATENLAEARRLMVEQVAA